MGIDYKNKVSFFKGYSALGILLMFVGVVLFLFIKKRIVDYGYVTNPDGSYSEMYPYVTLSQTYIYPFCAFLFVLGMVFLIVGYCQIGTLSRSLMLPII